MAEHLTTVAVTGEIFAALAAKVQSLQLGDCPKRCLWLCCAEHVRTRFVGG